MEGQQPCKSQTLPPQLHNLEHPWFLLDKQVALKLDGIPDCTVLNADVKQIVTARYSFVLLENDETVATMTNQGFHAELVSGEAKILPAAAS